MTWASRITPPGGWRVHGWWQQHAGQGWQSGGGLATSLPSHPRPSPAPSLLQHLTPTLAPCSRFCRSTLDHVTATNPASIVLTGDLSYADGYQPRWCVHGAGAACAGAGAARGTAVAAPADRWPPWPQPLLPAGHAVAWKRLQTQLWAPCDTLHVMCGCAGTRGSAWWPHSPPARSAAGPPRLPVPTPFQIPAS